MTKGQLKKIGIFIFFVQTVTGEYQLNCPNCQYNSITPYYKPYLTGVLSTHTVTSTEHVFCDLAVERFTAVTLFCGDDGECHSAEGGGDLPAGAGVSPPGHSTHAAFCYGGTVSGQQSDGDKAVQIDWDHQLEEAGNKIIS